MQEDIFHVFVHESKREYFRIRAVMCPALGFELVYFNRLGWNHLLRKGRKYRGSDEQLQRLALIKYAPDIIVGSATFYAYKEDIVTDSVAHFWEFRRCVQIDRNYISISVIVRKLNNGKIHFFSIFSR